MTRVESFEQIGAFIKPDILSERGEFTRVAETFSLDEGVLMHLAATDGSLVGLSRDVWDELDNTDSNRFEAGDWDVIAEHAAWYGRDWQSIKHALAKGLSYDAPIIMKFRGKYHLVSGNTRLMVARAMGIVPKVWLFEVYDNEG